VKKYIPKFITFDVAKSTKKDLVIRFTIEIARRDSRESEDEFRERVAGYEKEIAFTYYKSRGVYYTVHTHTAPGDRDPVYTITPDGKSATVFISAAGRRHEIANFVKEIRNQVSGYQLFIWKKPTSKIISKTSTKTVYSYSSAWDSNIERDIEDLVQKFVIADD